MHGSAFANRSQGVVEQIANNLLDTGAIYGGDGGRTVAAKGDRPFLGKHLARIHRTVDDRSYVLLLAVQADLPFVRLRQLTEILDQSVETLRLRGDNTETISRWLGNAILDRIEMPDDVGNRGAQLVSHV